VLKGSIEKFIAKRVLIVLILLSILDIIFIKNRWIALAGLFFGALLGMIKLSSMASAITKTLAQGIPSIAAKKSVFRFGINQIVAVLILIILKKIHLWLFIGAASGMLLIPFIITVNCLTEGFGITHNKFE
jgi:hypothetical protein